MRRRWNSWRRMGRLTPPPIQNKNTAPPSSITDRRRRINCVSLTRSALASPSHFFSEKTTTGSQTLHTRRRETTKNNDDCGVAPVVASGFCGVTGASTQATTSRVNFCMDVRPKEDSNNPKDLNTSSNLSNFDGSGGRLLSAKPKAKFPATNRRNRRERRATTGWLTLELFEFKTAAAKLFHERLAAWHAPHASVSSSQSKITHNLFRSL